MSASSTKVEKDEGGDRPREVARRALLRRGAKLAYIVPAVLTAMQAMPVDANAVSGIVCPLAVLKRGLDAVPADLLDLIAAIERESVAA